MKPLTISHISEDNDQLIFNNNLHFDCDYLQDLANKFQPNETLFGANQPDIFIILTTMAKDTNENWHYISYTAAFEANIGATHIGSKEYGESQTDHVYYVTCRPFCRPFDLCFYIPGINGSYARLTKNGWEIHGANNILDEQTEDEYAFKTSLSFDDIKKLPMDTPIYSAVHDFEDGNVTHSYETVADLYNNAQKCLRDNDDQPSYIPFAANHIDALNEVAETIFEQVTWQHFSSYHPDVANDMEDQPDAYPHCFYQN